MCRLTAWRILQAGSAKSERRHRTPTHALVPHKLILQNMTQQLTYGIIFHPSCIQSDCCPITPDPDHCLLLELSWKQMQEEKQMERRKKIAVELSELVVYCRPVPFNEDSKKQRLSSFYVLWFCVCGSHPPRCSFQKSGRRERATGTCPPSQRPKLRSLPREAEGNASCSTTAGSSPGFIPADRGSTRPTTTRSPCGSADPSWWR